MAKVNLVKTETTLTIRLKQKQ